MSCREEPNTMFEKLFNDFEQKQKIEETIAQLEADATEREVPDLVTTDYVDAQITGNFSLNTESDKMMVYDGSGWSPSGMLMTDITSAALVVDGVDVMNAIKLLEEKVAELTAMMRTPDTLESIDQFFDRLDNTTTDQSAFDAAMKGI